MADAPRPQVTGARKAWWKGLTSFTIPGWQNLNSNIDRFCIALSVNSMKSAHLGPDRPPVYASRERLYLMSYMEAILEPACGVITSTYDNRVLPALPTVEETWGANAPIAIVDGDAVRHFWDNLTHHQYGANVDCATMSKQVTTADARATKKIHYTNAQFTFLLALGKRGDMTNNYCTSAFRSIQTELGIDDLELFMEDVSWLATAMINPTNLAGSPAWAAVFKAVNAAANDDAQVFVSQQISSLL